jgi:hypothetical protein
MAKGGFVVGFIGMVQDLDAVLSSTNVPAEHKRALEADFRALKHRILESRRALERLNGKERVLQDVPIGFDFKAA